MEQNFADEPGCSVKSDSERASEISSAPENSDSEELSGDRGAGAMT